VAGTGIKYWSVLLCDIWGSRSGVAEDEGVIILGKVGSDVPVDMDATRLGYSVDLPFRPSGVHISNAREINGSLHTVPSYTWKN